MKHVKLQKPDLAEILSAFGGISCAAIGVTLREDEANQKAIKNAKEAQAETILRNDWPRHPLCVLEAKLSDIRYDSRHKLILGSSNTDQQGLQDGIAEKTLLALMDSLPILKGHEDAPLMRLVGGFGKKGPATHTGGTIRDVIIHIESMAEREAKGEGRALIHATGAGAITPVHTPPYMPKKQKAAAVENSDIEDMGADQFIEQIKAELQLSL